MNGRGQQKTNHVPDSRVSNSDGLLHNGRRKIHGGSCRYDCAVGFGGWSFGCVVVLFDEDTEG